MIVLLVALRANCSSNRHLQVLMYLWFIYDVDSSLDYKTWYYGTTSE